MELEKHSLLRRRNEQHRNIIKKYKVHYSPLFLPKLAVVGYHLHPDPSCQIFFSKLQLTDKTILQRENEFIDLMKAITASQEGSSDDNNQLFLIQWFKCSTKLSSKLLEEKHRYGQILNNRLNDLNELIFHIERYNQEPLLEKQCRQLLQKEITRINHQQPKLSRQTRDRTEEQENRQSNARKLFSLAQFKLNQKKIKHQNIKNLYRQNNRKGNFGRRLETEPNHNNQNNTYFQTKSVNRNSALQNSCRGEIEDLSMNPNILSKRDKNTGRHSLLNACDEDSKYNVQKVQQQTTSRRIGGIMKTEAFWKRPSNRKLMKSVRYMIEDDDAHSQKKQQKQSYNSKLTVSNNLKSSRSIRFKEPETNKMTPTSHFASKNKVSQRSIVSKHSKNPSNVSIAKQDDDSFPEEQKQDQEIASEQFERQSVSKKIYVPQKETVRLARRKDRKPKLSAFLMWDDQLQAKQVHRSNKKTKSKPRINIFKRQESNKEVETASAIAPANSKPSHIKTKRNGKLLGADANKHLQRLLRQSNVQEMLLQNELYQANQSFNKIKQSVHRNFGSLTVKNIDRLNNKHIISANNKILMEVDLEAHHKLMEELKNKNYDEYVQNQGFAVKLDELKTFRKQYVDINAYYHNYISSFYGGDKAALMNFQIITNERGQYSFNRQFIQKMSKDANEEEFQYRFPQCDPCDLLAFELGGSLVRECQDLSQKQLIKSSILVDQPDAIPLVLY